MLSIEFDNVFNVKVSDHKTEEYGSPFVAPEAGSGGTLVASGFLKHFRGFVFASAPA